MTKSTKIIAALGVAAGLGIAALPSGAIFADMNWPLKYDEDAATTAGKDVTVKLEVGEAIALGVSTNECKGDSDSATTGIQNFGIADEGQCVMQIAGATNAAHGFDLKVKKKDNATTFLALGGNTAVTEASAKVAAVNGTAVDADHPGWNLTGGALTNFGDFDTLTTIMRTTVAAQAKNDVTYNFATRADQQAGVYSTQLTYTIAKNEPSYAEEDTAHANPIWTGITEAGIDHESVDYYRVSNN